MGTGASRGGIPSVPGRGAGTRFSVNSRLVVLDLLLLFLGFLFLLALLFLGLPIHVILQSGQNVRDMSLHVAEGPVLAPAQVGNGDLSEIVDVGLGEELAFILE